MSAVTIDIDMRLDDEDWRELGVDCAAVCRLAIEAAAHRTQTKRASLDLLLTSDDEMRRLNSHWRGIDKPTDVLSFPASDGPGQADVKFLGDIAMGFGTCVRDADRLGRDMSRHMSHLAAHGFLHLLGYDHVDSTGAAAMEALEVQILGDLGYPDPYEWAPPSQKSAPVR